MTVPDESRWTAAPPRASRVPDVPYLVPAAADQLGHRLDVTVLSEPGRSRDELVRALAGCSLLRVRVAPGIRAVAPVLVGPSGRRTGIRRRPARGGVVVLRSASPSRDVRAQVSAGETAPILVLSPETEESEVVRTLQAGATSYLVDGRFRAAEVLAAALGTAAGRSHLSPAALAAVVRRLQHPDLAAVPAELAALLSRRERQIMEMVADGHPNAYIARREFIAEKTVRNHLNNIYGKLGVRSRAEAILVWLGRTHPTG